MANDDYTDSAAPVSCFAEPERGWLLCSAGTASRQRSARDDVERANKLNDDIKLSSRVTVAAGTVASTSRDSPSRLSSHFALLVLGGS